MTGSDLAGDVSTDDTYVVEPEGEQRFTVVAYDMGIKTNTPRNFVQRGIRTIVVPANTSYEDIMRHNPDGVFVSNGPGDPATADEMVAVVREVLAIHYQHTDTYVLDDSELQRAFHFTPTPLASIFPNP